MRATGTLSSKKINMNVVGTDLLMKQIENLKKWIHPHLSGLLQLNTKIHGSFQRPLLKIKGEIEKMAYGRSSIGNSDLNLLLNHRQLSGSIGFDNQKLSIKKLQFDFPKKHRNLLLQIQANQFNFAPLIHVFSPSNNVTLQASGEALLQIPNNQWKALSGYLNVDRLSLKQGTQILESSEPLSVRFQKGQLQWQKPTIKWKNNDQWLSLITNKNQSTLSGPIRMELISLFLPFVSNGHRRFECSTNHQQSSTKIYLLKVLYRSVMARFDLKNFLIHFNRCN